MNEPWQSTEARLRQRMSQLTQAVVAARSGYSPTIVTSWLEPQGNEKVSKIELVARVICALEFDLVPQGARVLQPTEVAFDGDYALSVETLAKRHIEETQRRREG